MAWPDGRYCGSQDLSEQGKDSMLGLLQELRSSTVGTDGHNRYKLGDKTLHAWFTGGILLELMRALSKPDNAWVVPWDAENSPLVRDFAAGTNRMAQALDRRFPKLGNQVGRLVIVRWINAGCPIPGEAVPLSKVRSEPLAPASPDRHLSRSLTEWVMYTERNDRARHKTPF